MCTAITFTTNDFYFGRTLDYDFSFGEDITITPRNFPLVLKNKYVLNEHYAIIGMAHIADNYPLYYEGANEKGLCMAGLNFVSNAHYRNEINGKDNIAPFELIPWILGTCCTVKQAKEKLKNINITNIQFNEKLPNAQLHWIISDREGSIVVESVKDAINVYNNDVGVLTNNPPFDLQRFNLNNYLTLSNKDPQSKFSSELNFNIYSRGMGAMGLPGDLSSSSRFIRAAFTKLNSVKPKDEYKNLSQFFHIMGSVEQVEGCCVTEDNNYEKTLYTCCINADKGIYYYTTYHNRVITGIDLHRINLNRDKLVRYKLNYNEQINFQN